MFYHFSHCIGFHFISPSITFTCTCFFSVLGAYLWLGTPHLQLFSTPPVFKVGLLSSVSASLKIHMIFHNEERVERRRTDWLKCILLAITLCPFNTHCLSNLENKDNNSLISSIYWWWIVVKCSPYSWSMSFKHSWPTLSLTLLILEFLCDLGLAMHIPGHSD